MDGRGNEGHTENQPRRSTLLHRQSYKLFRLDKVV